MLHRQRHRVRAGMADACVGEELRARRLRRFDDMAMLRDTPLGLARRDQKHLIGARERRGDGADILVTSHAQLDAVIGQVLPHCLIANMPITWVSGAILRRSATTSRPNSPDAPVTTILSKTVMVGSGR
jgi:hypothetical protein